MSDREKEDILLPLLKKIDSQSTQQLHILSAHTKKLESIETIAGVATAQIADSIKDIAKHLGDTVQTNKELINIIAGKRQVPLSVFIIVLFVMAIVEFIVLAQIFSIGLEFDAGLFKGRISVIEEFYK